MKLEVLVANEEALKMIVESKFDDAQLAWDLSETFDDVEKAITKFQKTRDEYVKENGKPDPKNPERFHIADPEAFGEEMKKLLEVEVDIVFPKISLSALKVQLSVKEMRSLKALGIIERPVVEQVEKIEPEKD